MGRIKRKKEDVKKIKDSIAEERKEVVDSLPPMVKDTGGSIAALNSNKSLYFKKWVTDLQKKNICIGKSYLTAAEEYNTESKMVGEPEMGEMTPEMLATLNNGAEEYKSNIENPDTSDIGAFLKDKDAIEEEVEHDEAESLKEAGAEAEIGFIDITIVENLTKELQDQMDEDIESAAREKLKEYHQNPEYEPKIDIPSVIENYKDVMIAQENPHKKLLE